jgi:DNA processing protein
LASWLLDLIGFRQWVRQRLVEKIIKSGQGAVVSEFPLGMTPIKGSFSARNRIISGLLLGVLVTEGATRSGAKITASHAAAQGREVFAVPGPITSRISAAPADLIKMGAKLVYKVDDILEELNLEDRGKGIKARKVIPESPEEEKLLALIQDEAKHLDQLVRESGLETGLVASIMSLMEIKGKVKNLGGMAYIIKR